MKRQERSLPTVRRAPARRRLLGLFAWSAGLGLMVSGCPAILEDNFEKDDAMSTIQGSGATGGTAGETADGGPDSSTGGTGASSVTGGGTGGGTGATGGSLGGTGGEPTGGSGGTGGEPIGGSGGTTGGSAGSSGAGAGGEPAGGSGGSTGGGTGGTGGGGMGGAGGGPIDECTDGIRNQDETDVDCGGTICAACADGMSCLDNGDCQSGTCSPSSIVYVETTSFNSGTNPSFSQSVSVSSAQDRMLVVAIGIEAQGFGGAVTSITLDGTDMNLAVEETVTTNYLQHVYLYYLGEAALPTAAGSYDLVISVNTPMEYQIHVIELAGVADQAPEGTNTNSSGGMGVSDISTDVETQTNDSWVVDVVAASENVQYATTEPGQVERGQNGGGSSSTAVSTQPVPTAGQTTLGWELSMASGRLVQAAAAFAPVASGGLTCQP